MDCLRIQYLVLFTLVFLVMDAGALHKGLVTGPNVCGKPYNTHCCDGWELHPTLRKCFVPVCQQDCGEGYCHRPNLCSCPSGILSSIGCEPNQDNMVHVVLRAISDGPCNPPCRNGGHCGNGGRCVCPYGFMGMDCSVDYRTGPCYRRIRSGTCSEPVMGLRSTKALCCATLGEAWGNSCEECSGVSMCPRGYMKDYRTDECLDVDECLVIPGICESGTGVCENTKGSFRCHDKGKPLSFSRTMGVREETDYRTGPCYRSFSNGACSEPVVGLRSSKALCCATLGQAWGNDCEQCDMSQCQQGYIYDVPTGDCLDVDECVLIPGLCWSGTGTCQNTVGSFICQDKGIPLSFNASNDASVGLLEQGDATGPCYLHANAGTCSYPVTGLTATKEVCCGTVGKGWGSACEPCATFPLQCQPGLSMDEVTGLCVDVNECELLPELCQGGSCQNTEGGFACQAKGRPRPHSVSTTGTNLGPCFLLDTAGSCSFEVAGFLSTKELCCGTVGQAWGESCESCATYRSQCSPGYSLDEATRRCMDINECELLPDVCQRGTCQNTEGSFTCQSKGQPLSFIMINQNQANERTVQETITVGIDSFQLVQVLSDGSIQDVQVKMAVGIASNVSNELTADDFKAKIHNLAQSKDISSLEEFGIDICKAIFDFSQIQNCKVNVKQEPWRERSQPGGWRSYFHCTKYLRSADVSFSNRNGPVEVSGSLSDFKILKMSQHSEAESPSEHSSHTVSSTKLAVRCVFRNGQGNDYQHTWNTVISTISEVFSGTLDNETLPAGQSDTEIASLIAHTILENAASVLQITIDMTTVDYTPIGSDSGSSRKVLSSPNQPSRTTSVALQRTDQ